MAIPPERPLKIGADDSKLVTYFEFIVMTARPYLVKDGISLTFKGYTETLSAYNTLDEKDTHKAWQLTKELNSWTEYFSSIKNLLQKLYLDAETEKIEAQAIASVNSDCNKVANGDRLANKDSSVVEARKKRNCLKAFYDELDNKIKFLERAYYHCKATCDWNNKLLTPNDIDKDKDNNKF